MESATAPSPDFSISRSTLLRIIIFIVFAALTSLPLFVVSSASLPRKNSADGAVSPGSHHNAPVQSLALLPQGPFVPESIALYESDCLVSNDSFIVGDTVCAKAAGTIFGTRNIYWVDSQGSVVQVNTITSASPSATRVVGVSGNWRVYLSDSDGLRAVSRFQVSDPQLPTVDLSVNNDIDAGTDFAAGGFVTYRVVAVNKGPDSASEAQLAVQVPNGASLVSSSQDSGPTFNCTDSTFNTTCTIESFANEASATFTFIYQLTAGTPVGTVISNTATISSVTTELHTPDNSSTSESKIVSGAAPTSCTLDCPNNMTVVANTSEGGNPGAKVTFSSAEGFGECGEITSSTPSGSFFPVGTTTVVVTSTTGGGSCAFNVTVVTTGAPTIACPDDQIITAGTGATEATVDPGNPTTNPATGVSVSSQRSDNELLSAPYPIGSTVITWTVTDGAGLTASCAQRITVNSDGCGTDTTVPTITAPPNVIVDTPVDTQGSCGVVIGETALGTPDAQDNCTVNVTRTGVPAGNFFPVGTTTITYTATDSAGNTATATQNVIISDKTPPVIFAPADASYDCPSQVPVGNPSQATGPDVIISAVPQPGPPADSCSAVAVTVADSSTGAGSASSPLVVTRTFTAVDAAGNLASATQTITVTDAVAPTISAPANASYQCVSDVPIAHSGDATASDNCDSPTVTVSESSNGGAGSTGSPLVITRTFTATDAAGNSASASQTITVIDNTLPTITAPAAVTVNTGTGAASCDIVVSNATLGAASADDNCAGVTVTRSPSGNTFPVGTTNVVWTATDAAGNIATATQQVTVNDNTAPIITAPATKTLYTGAGATSCDVTINVSDLDATLGTATAADNCSGVTWARGGGNVFPLGNTTVTYTATDAHGNTASATQTVTVVDNTQPVVTAPANLTEYLPLNSTATSRAVSYPNPATATDNCGGPISLVYSPASGSTFSVGTSTVTVTATDAHNNSASATFTVTVLYNFTGFFSPVNNLPTLNSVNAGRAIPVKFSLSGNKGLGIFVADTPVSVGFDCGTGPDVEVEETLTAGGSSLSFGGDQYNYVWKTESSWVGTCRQLVITLNDGSVHKANFKFK